VPVLRQSGTLYAEVEGSRIVNFYTVQAVERDAIEGALLEQAADQEEEHQGRERIEKPFAAR